MMFPGLKESPREDCLLFGDISGREYRIGKISEIWLIILIIRINYNSKDDQQLSTYFVFRLW